MRNVREQIHDPLGLRVDLLRSFDELEHRFVFRPASHVEGCLSDDAKEPVAVLCDFWVADVECGCSESSHDELSLMAITRLVMASLADCIMDMFCSAWRALAWDLCSAAAPSAFVAMS
jgi:hypothetical protein